MAIFLVDLENVGLAGLAGIDKLSEKNRVIIFYGTKTGSIAFDKHVELSSVKAEVSYRKAEKTGKNYLDFQLATYLGYLIGTGENGGFHIVSKDTGYESVIDFWKKHKPEITICRQSEIQADKKEEQQNGKSGKPEKKEGRKTGKSVKKGETKTGKTDKKNRPGNGKSGEESDKLKEPAAKSKKEPEESVTKSGEEEQTKSGEIAEPREGAVAEPGEGAATVPGEKGEAAIIKRPKEEAEKRPEKNRKDDRAKEAGEKAAGKQEEEKSKEPEAGAEKKPEMEAAKKPESSKKRKAAIPDKSNRKLAEGNGSGGLPESTRKKIRKAVREENLKGGSYARLYEYMVKYTDKQKLNNALVKTFQQEQGNRIYRLLRDIFVDYHTEVN